MSLIICPDCKTSVSNKAYSCPKCGRVIKYWTAGKIIVALILAPIVFIFFFLLIPFLAAP